jgi:predicted ribonuclease toxin of YeeF-YezG toxin-antitoxin module
VGKFQLTLNSPVENSTNIVNSGANISVTASTSLPSTFKLKANGATVNSTSVTATTYSYSYNVTQDAVMELEATNASDLSVQTKNFVVATTPNVQTAAIPSWIRQGINYDANDATKIGLAIYAPGKVMFM